MAIQYALFTLSSHIRLEHEPQSPPGLAQMKHIFFLSRTQFHSYANQTSFIRYFHFFKCVAKNRERKKKIAYCK